MFEPDWNEVAKTCAGTIVRMRETPPEGAMVLPDHPGVFIAFGPHGYMDKTQEQLIARGATVLGTGLAVNPCGTLTFVILYRQRSPAKTASR